MITIDYRNPTPIYKQIAEGIIKAISLGEFAPDEALPSVRKLSGELGINPNTIQKAYSELLNEGVVYSVAGRGMFISSDRSAKKLIEDNIKSALKNIAEEAKTANISYADLCSFLKENFNDEGEK